MIRRGCDNDPQGMRCNNHSHTTYRKERSGKHWKHCRMRREEAEGQTKYKSEVCEHRGDANAFLATGPERSKEIFGMTAAPRFSSNCHDVVFVGYFKKLATPKKKNKKFSC